MKNINSNNLVGAEKLRELVREELKNTATKDDLKGFATKDDLKNFATKDDFNNLADKVLGLDTKIDNVKEDLQDQMNEKFDKVLESNDKLGKKMDIIIAESAAHSKSYKDNEEEIEKHEEVLDNHENRIKVLEIQPAI